MYSVIEIMIQVHYPTYKLIDKCKKASIFFCDNNFFLQVILASLSSCIEGLGSAFVSSSK